MKDQKQSAVVSTGVSGPISLDLTLKSISISAQDRFYRYLDQIQEFSELLTSNHQEATQLTLSYNTYSLQVAELLSNIIRQCKLLQQFIARKIIKIWNQAQQSSVLQTFCGSIQSLPDLVVLDLASNRICQVEILARTVHSLSNLQILNLSDNCIGAEGGMKLAEALVQGQIRLVNFSVSNNKLENSGTLELAHAFAWMETLCDLDISRNQIGKTGVKALAKAFKTNQSLRVLDIHDNYFNDPQCVIYLAKGLSSLPKLRRLNIGDSSLGNEGVITVLNVLKQKKIQVLNLSYNDIDQNKVFDCIAEFVREQDKLEFICLTGNDVDQEQVERMVNNRPDLLFEVDSVSDVSEDFSYGQVFASDVPEGYRYEGSGLIYQMDKKYTRSFTQTRDGNLLTVQRERKLTNSGRKEQRTELFDRRRFNDEVFTREEARIIFSLFDVKREGRVKPEDVVLNMNEGVFSFSDIEVVFQAFDDDCDGSLKINDFYYILNYNN